ncbi:hypothetical protein OH458_15565 [Vibrio sp. MarTm2]|uniref:hypothetical protein n=1 Tax=Vibrio sp. MarTm2 TaxID=2998831 RepID=UPI0022CD6F9C|nr:hypothetical protein [Vibrio sp. MarTm2]MDA0129487.1 hypothetical protein [Vibrio sp. MarTm2]
MSRSFLALVSTLLISNAIFASDDDRYLYALGYGESESGALQDAKIQMALNLLSVVEVNEKSSVVKTSHDVDSSFSQDSSIHSLPIQIPRLEVLSHECGEKGCEYRYRLSKKTWQKQVEHDLTASYQTAAIKLKNLNNNWRGVKDYFHAEELVSKSAVQLDVLGILDSEAAESYRAQHLQISEEMNAKREMLSISFVPSNDAFSHQIHELLSRHAFASNHGGISVYIKTKSQQGRQGKDFVVKQSIQLKVFDSNSSHMVTQKVITVLGKSQASSAEAKHAAEQKIIKKLTNKSIYSVLI